MSQSADTSVPAIAIDATYAVDTQPSGISVYSRRLIESLAGIQSPYKFLICYRYSRWRRRSHFLQLRPRSRYSTCLFQEPWTFWLPKRAVLFHSLAQRPAPFRFRKEVVTVHDVFPLTGRDYSDPEFLRKFSRLLIESVQRASRIITPSQYTAAQLSRYAQGVEGKICVVPEGVDPPVRLLSADERRGLRERYVGAGKEMILVVGVIQTRKNTVGALRALCRLPERYRMVLAGGQGYGAEVASKFISANALGGRVTVTGHLRREDLSALYQAASVLLFPSFEEGFGLPLLEAMSHGLPAVSSNTASLPEVGGDAVLYTDPHDETQMAAQVLIAVEDRDLRERMIAAGQSRAREFSWKRTAERTLEVYAEVLGGTAA